jgi:selenocysteine lyase/cysteine desulfurase
MLEEYFKKYKDNTIGNDLLIETPFGIKKLIYADWTASGRLYQPIEEKISSIIGQYVANTHSETSLTGRVMTKAYNNAKQIIKKHVNASHDDVLICSESGMTGVINKFQRILGLKLHERFRNSVTIPEADKPVIFITSMEHHSNQTSWLETIADVEIIGLNDDGITDIEHLKSLLTQYSKRKVRIAAITSCSNVTGILTNYHEIAKIMHQNGGLCFVDFAASAPYINIDMHPQDNDCRLDAIFFSPHKFLGGPGSTGVLIFNSSLYKNSIPDNPGGGTVEWTNPWGGHKFVDDIESREDGGTPPFLQTIKVAFAIQLKEDMGVDKMAARESELSAIIWESLDKIPNLHVLAGNLRDRLPIFSFYIDDCHYNLAVQLLNDRFGIQARGGCSCAGTYGHILLNVDKVNSKTITDKINDGDLSVKPGWVRISLHPTMTDEEVNFICFGISQIAENFQRCSRDYNYDELKNSYIHKFETGFVDELTNDWFKWETSDGNN